MSCAERRPSLLLCLAFVGSVWAGACGEQTTGPAKPLLVSVSPDTVMVLDSVELTLVGEDFTETSVAVLNRRPFPTSYELDGTLRVRLPFWALTEPGDIEIAVTSDGTRAGASNALTIVVLGRAPQIRGFSPSSAITGSGGFMLTVMGQNIQPTAQLTWDGIPKPTTHVDPGTLRIEVGAAELAAVGAGILRIEQEGTASSAAAGFPIVPVGPPTRTVNSMLLTTSGLAADPVRELVYAVVPPSAPTRQNQFVALDPQTRSVVWSLQLPSLPSDPVVTDDGSFAYVSQPEEYTVVRIDLESRNVVLTIPLPEYDWSTIRPPSATVAMDIVAVPGQPRTIIVPLAEVCCTPKRAGTVVLDDAVARPVRSGGHRVEMGAGGDHVYAVGSGGFSLLRIVPDGIRFVGSVPIASNQATDIIEDGGWVFSGDGWMMDGEYLLQLLNYAVSGPIRPDTPSGRIHVYSADALQTFHYLTGAHLGTIPVPEAAGSDVLVRFGADGLVFGGSDRLTFLRSDLIGG